MAIKSFGMDSPEVQHFYRRLLGAECPDDCSECMRLSEVAEFDGVGCA